MKANAISAGFACALFALSALPGGAVAQEPKQNFTLVNRTGYDLAELYISPANASDWEDDVLEDDELEEGESRAVAFHPSVKTCLWDMKVVYSIDESEAVWRSIDLCRVSKITLRYDKPTDKTTAVFD